MKSSGVSGNPNAVAEVAPRLESVDVDADIKAAAADANTSGGRGIHQDDHRGSDRKRRSDRKSGRGSLGVTLVGILPDEPASGGEFSSDEEDPVGRKYVGTWWYVGKR